MRELRGKGWRVLGYFLWMLGAGVVLDSGRSAPAASVLAVGGAALFSLGSVQSLGGAGSDGMKSRSLRIAISVAISALFLGLRCAGSTGTRPPRRCAAPITSGCC